MLNKSYDMPDFIGFFLCCLQLNKRQDNWKLCCSSALYVVITSQLLTILGRKISGSGNLTDFEAYTYLRKPHKDKLNLSLVGFCDRLYTNAWSSMAPSSWIVQFTDTPRSISFLNSICSKRSVTLTHAFTSGLRKLASVTWYHIETPTTSKYVTFYTNL